MKPHHALLAAFLTLTGPLGGCTSPEPTYYALAAQPGAAQPGGPRTVLLRRVGLADYLDRPDIVQSNADYQLRIANNQHWGETLSSMASRVLAEDLTQRLSGSSVFSAAGSISADTDATVEADIQRFDRAQDGQVVLIAQVAVSRGRSDGDRLPAITRTFRLSLPTGPGTVPMVAGMSTLLGQLSDRIAGMLRGVDES